MAERVFSYDEMFAAMCIMEEIADPQFKDAPTPWQDYRDAWGIGGLRDAVINKLALACDEAWDRATEKFSEEHEKWVRATEIGKQVTGEVPGPPPDDPGSFDYEFVPVWLRLCVDWSDLNEGPRVRGTTVSEQKPWT